MHNENNAEIAEAQASKTTWVYSAHFRVAMGIT